MGQPPRTLGLTVQVVPAQRVIHTKSLLCQPALWNPKPALPISVLAHAASRWLIPGLTDLNPCLGKCCLTLKKAFVDGSIQTLNMLTCSHGFCYCRGGQKFGPLVAGYILAWAINDFAGLFLNHRVDDWWSNRQRNKKSIKIMHINAYLQCRKSK